jgi:PAS domain S-box-containing protein
MEEVLEILRHTADGAYIIDDQQRIIFWNESAETLLGYTAEEVMGRLCYEVFAGRDERGNPMCRRDCGPLIASTRGKLVPNFDTLIRTKDGESRWVNVSIIVVPGQDEGRHAVIHLFRDIDAKKQAEAFAVEVAARARQLRMQGSRGEEEPGRGGAGERGRGSLDNRSQAPRLPCTPAPLHPCSLDELTPREYQVLELLARGADTETIATELVISEATVRNHIQHILRKLGVHSRLEAAAYAREHDLI